MNNWEKVNQTAQYSNEVLARDGYYISYNPAPIWANGGEETAIVVDGNFYILHGDYRQVYEDCPTLKDCLNHYLEHLDKKSGWSNEITDEHLAIAKGGTS